MDIGAKELLVIAVVLVILFGSKKIPQFSQAIVDATHNLQDAFKDKDNVSKNKKNLS